MTREAKTTAETIEKVFFDFVSQYKRTPSRKEIVEILGIPGASLLEILGDASKNLSRTWALEKKERYMLGKLIIENDKSLHNLIGPISFLPVWSAQCKVMNRKNKS